MKISKVSSTIVDLVMSRLNADEIIRRSKRWDGYTFKDHNDVRDIVSSLLRMVYTHRNTLYPSSPVWATTAGAMVYVSHGVIVVAWDERMHELMVHPRDDCHSDKALSSLSIRMKIDYVSHMRREIIRKAMHTQSNSQ